ncbi:MAG: AAA family ATPase [Propionivibrio sp.]|nr:AAA family ATPase [Propionivibrio sp.]
MYLDHFGLREAPFRITPHTEFFFAGANRGATLEALVYAITHDEGIVKVSGEVGSGKTMLCRMLLEKLPDNVETVYLANPSLSRDEILYAIAEELQTPLPETRSHLLLRALQDRLLEIYAAGRQVVVMIDEAHAMPPETLEEIRLLSNLESNRHKLLHIVLFGQPELDDHLGETNMRQLKERITHNFALEPLRRSDIGSYLMFRIRAAGYHGPDLFTPGAIQLISKASEGLTRRINILADKALLSAFSENRHQIDNRQIKAAIRDAQFNPMRDGNARPMAWIAGAGAITLIAAVAYLAGSYTSASTPAPVSRVVAPTPAATDALAPATTASASTAATPSMPQTPPTPLPEKPPTLAERIAASEDWLKNTPDNHYFIQLLSTDGNNARDVEIFLENNTGWLDPQQIRVYRSRLSGRERLGVIYGDYPTREAARAELHNLARTSSIGNPYVRSVSKLR